MPKATTTLREFLEEFHYSYFLSPHANILDTYDVAFETRDHYFFAQEVAPFGDLYQVSFRFHYYLQHSFVSVEIIIIILGVKTSFFFAIGGRTHRRCRS